MELVKTDDPINKITESYRPFIIALRSLDIKGCDRATNLKAIIASITKATALTGKINVDNGFELHAAENLLNEFISRWPHAKHTEIELAFKKGVLGDYGEYFGINVKSLLGFWKSYIQSPELLQAKREWIKLMDEPKVAKTITNVDLTESILKAFEDFKKTGELPFTSSHYYIILCKLHNVKTLIKDKDLRSTIREEAMKDYRASLVEKKINLKDRPQFDVLLKWCMEGKNPTYDTFSRKLALKYYFTECKTLNKLPI